MQADNHDESFSSDKETLSNQSQVGCYYCEQLMTYEDIETFVNGDQTALCPYCGIDAVVGLDAVPTEERTILLMTWNHQFFG